MTDEKKVEIDFNGQLYISNVDGREALLQTAHDDFGRDEGTTMTEINASQFVSVRQTITTPDYRTAWQVVFAVNGVFSPECVIGTHDTKEHADDEAKRFHRVTTANH